MSPKHRRREFLGALALTTLAGCVDGGSSGPRDPNGEVTSDAESDAFETDEDGSSAPDPADGPPLAETSYTVPHGLETVTENIIITDARIPTVDDPVLTDAAGIADAPFELAEKDIVFGVERDGVVKAYPQRILVYHEIVNDELAGDPVSITYCPLTGTAQGFECGEGFEVSNSLFNSNLIMVDQGTETWWPQMYATGIHDPFAGDSLQEFRLIWTTWERWHEAHPDTRVMTADTGYERRYHDDPNGGYNPMQGYYDFGGPMYETLAEPPDELPLEDKTVVIGTRTESGAAAFEKSMLLEENVLRADIDGTEHVAVADESLATGYVYANPAGASIEHEDGDRYSVDGETGHVSELPLNRRIAFDSMWFAWYAHYPNTAIEY